MFNVHKGQECILLTCGPSLNDVTEEDILARCLANPGARVAAVKQAYLKIPNLVDYHFWNCCNLPIPVDGIHYNYQRFKPTVIASSNYKLGFRWNPKAQPHDLFYHVPITNKFLCRTKDFDNWTFDKTETRPCGPGIMYETVIFMLVHMGFSKITAVGWDLSQHNQDKAAYKHFYDDNKPLHVPGTVMPWEVRETCLASKDLYYWLLKRGVQLELASTKSALYDKIPRVEL